MPHRQPLLDLLARYVERHPEEHHQVDRFERFVRQEPHCFERSLTVGHVTGSAWLTDRGAERVLLTHHRKLDAWLQLGGHADGQTDALTVALKEAREESGIEGIAPVSTEIFDLDIHSIPERTKKSGLVEPEHFHYDVRFALKVTVSETYQVSEESNDLAWVEIREIARYQPDASVLRMAKKWLS